ncbi:MAG TPA: hypothetical protein VMV89_05925, partial [Candidatus Paceibacterota bacterium]|nr:hypothetical protein [Candidatus Paceibacterota bacterium]
FRSSFSRRAISWGNRCGSSACCTDDGKRFIEAWKRVRNIVDTGGGHSGTPPTPPTPPATPGK